VVNQGTMETVNILWVIALILILVIINILLHLIAMYIANKPLGYQAIYDVVFTDNLRLAQFASSVTIFVEILSRFENIECITVANIKIAFISCSLFFLSFVLIFVYTGCVCILRIICLLNMNFVEERIGEKGIRRALILFALIMSITAFVVIIEKDEMNSGPIYSMLIGKRVLSGELKISLFIFMKVSALRNKKLLQ
jgi:hypothetical protein